MGEMTDGLIFTHNALKSSDPFEAYPWFRFF